MNGAHTSEAAPEAESEVIAERLLRELTAEHVGLLTTLQDTGVQDSHQSFHLSCCARLFTS